jgi:hypothetical protein
MGRVSGRGTGNWQWSMVDGQETRRPNKRKRNLPRRDDRSCTALRNAEVKEKSTTEGQAGKPVRETGSQNKPRKWSLER